MYIFAWECFALIQFKSCAHLFAILILSPRSISFHVSVSLVFFNIITLNIYNKNYFVHFVLDCYYIIRKKIYIRMKKKGTNMRKYLSIDNEKKFSNSFKFYMQQRIYRNEEYPFISDSNVNFDNVIVLFRQQNYRSTILPFSDKKKKM